MIVRLDYVSALQGMRESPVSALFVLIIVMNMVHAGLKSIWLLRLDAPTLFHGTP